eukprot:g30725.t1
MFSRQRVLSAWNMLPEKVVEADTIATFKKHLDEYMNKKGIEGVSSVGQSEIGGSRMGWRDQANEAAQSGTLNLGMGHCLPNSGNIFGKLGHLANLDMGQL